MNPLPNRHRHTQPQRRTGSRGPEDAAAPETEHTPSSPHHPPDDTTDDCLRIAHETLQLIRQLRA
ncbi:hypothetical protein [Thioalkalivibrio sp. ALJT]|uniref:hypothetical protein n=1 Tax=Thioalkalivibrio sp. ALJT TaxID=1158146 RepID=UPI0003A4A467|nr:hypothetical protein [Thioalkalivibrio sp. ALJT]